MPCSSSPTTQRPPQDTLPHHSVVERLALRLAQRQPLRVDGSCQCHRWPNLLCCQPFKTQACEGVAQQPNVCSLRLAGSYGSTPPVAASGGWPTKVDDSEPCTTGQPGPVLCCRTGAALPPAGKATRLQLPGGRATLAVWSPLLGTSSNAVIFTVPPIASSCLATDEKAATTAGSLHSKLKRLFSKIGMFNTAMCTAHVKTANSSSHCLTSQSWAATMSSRRRHRCCHRQAAAAAARRAGEIQTPIRAAQAPRLVLQSRPRSTRALECRARRAGMMVAAGERHGS